jgi:hypothetical protein
MLLLICLYKYFFASWITEVIVLLNDTYKIEMFTLVGSVFSGYYLPNTNRRVNYYGMFKENKLVAMAGENYL